MPDKSLAASIPGPDPGACPKCGEWVKAGMRHTCMAAKVIELRCCPTFAAGFGIHFTNCPNYVPWTAAQLESAWAEVDRRLAEADDD